MPQDPTDPERVKELIRKYYPQEKASEPVVLSRAPRDPRTFMKEEEKRTILIVDDFPQARSLYHDSLEAGGYRPLTAASGEEALTVLSATRVDLVLLDYDLPDMDGIAILRRIRKSQNPVPVLMITGSDRREIVEEAVRAGASGYLVKPVKLDELMSRISRTLAEPAQREKPPLA
ncbi:MAG: response regulator [Armatimonadetes bacterium]|nr:response regulator [Armatimonadota bacterium]